MHLTPGETEAANARPPSQPLSTVAFGLYLFSLIALALPITLPIGVGLQLSTLACLGSAAVWVLDLMLQRGRGFRLTPLTVAAGVLFLVLAGLQIAAGASLAALGGLFYMLLLLELTRFFAIQGRLSTMLLAWATAATFVVLAGLAGFGFALLGHGSALITRHGEFPYFGNFQRVLSTFSNPSALVGYLLIGIVLAFYGLPRQRWARWTSGVCGMLCCILALSKLTLFIVFGLFFTTGKRALAGFGALALVLGVVLPLGVFSKTPFDSGTRFLFPGIFPERAQAVSVGGLTGIWTPTNYAVCKSVAFEIWRSHPWTGVGLQNYRDAAAEMVKAGRAPFGVLGFAPHSTYLGLAAESGVVGILALLAAIVVSMRTLRRNRSTENSALRGALMTAGLVWLAVAVHSDILRFPSLWFYLGLVAALPEVSDPA